MLKRIWRRFQEKEAERALREHDEAQRDGLAEGDRLPPPFKNTDWGSR